MTKEKLAELNRQMNEEYRNDFNFLVKAVNSWPLWDRIRFCRDILLKRFR